jgi:hypothetical protein
MDNVSDKAPDLKRNFLRLFFKSEDGEGHYPVTELPKGELEWDDEIDVAVYFLRLTHSPGWITQGRRRMRFGDCISIDDKVYQFNEEEGTQLPGLWAAYRIGRV